MKSKSGILIAFLILLALMLFPSVSTHSINIEYGDPLSIDKTALFSRSLIKPETISLDMTQIKNAIGSYPIDFSYSIGPFEKHDTLQINVVDTTSPQITQIKEEIILDTKDTHHDFLQYFKIDDNNDTTIELNTDSIDFNSEGRYPCSIKVTDTSNNESTLDFEVIVKNTINEDTIRSILSKHQGTIEIYYKNLDTNAEYVYNDANMYPCSIIKMCVLFAMYDQDFIDIDSCRSLMEAMMISSNNDAYNELLVKLGKGSGIDGLHYVNNYLRSIGIFHTELHHSLSPSSSNFEDGKDNFTCPSDIGKMLEMVYRNELFSKKDTREIIDLLSRCADTSAIATGLPSTTTFAHKSGWADDYYLDGGIIYGKRSDYILVIFTKGDANCFQELSSYFYSIS